VLYLIEPLAADAGRCAVFPIGTAKKPVDVVFASSIAAEFALVNAALV